MQVRTTLTLDDDVLDAARRIAESDGRPLGRVVSELARQALLPRAHLVIDDQDLPVFVVPEGTRTIDPAAVTAAAAQW